MFERFGKFMNDDTGAAKVDMIGKIIGVVFGVYVVAYALTPAILALVNVTGFAATSPILPILSTLIPILLAIGVGWMFYKHMALK